MSNYRECNHLVLLIGTNPLPNFVVADYLLQVNPHIGTIWLLHSEQTVLQEGTDRQAANLEALLRERWEDKYENLNFPLEKISLSDVSDGAAIRRDIETKMLRRWAASDQFHLNYTGGTKAMAIHVYLHLREVQKRGQKPYSYLDANNFRLIGDDYGIIADDLRQKVQIEFAELIALHGFARKNRDAPEATQDAEQKFHRFLEHGKKGDIGGGHWLEVYLAQKLRDRFSGKLGSESGVLRNWEIHKPTWRTKFELDIVLLYGYHLIGLSCYVGSRKDDAKKKGFEIIQRCRQIGGDEARAIIVAGLERPHTALLQEELKYETGRNQKNAMVLGLADLRNEECYLSKIERFVFG